MGLTFSVYLLRPIYPDCEPPKLTVQLLAASMILILTGVNCWSVKVTTVVQDWFTYGKVFALVAVIFTGGYLLIFGKEHVVLKSFEHFKLKGRGISE
ncbi:hypothetical protein COOONC_03307 [Cooperia oncophora]